MKKRAFDEHAETYDAWFLKNENVLESEVRLLARFLDASGEVLSVGCGSGLFETILRSEHGVDIRHGVEPSSGMAAIAAKRGIQVRSGAAEAIPWEDSAFDTVLMNGIPSYVKDLEQAYREGFRVLRRGGQLIVADVPASSSYGMLYQLAAAAGSWTDERLAKIAPADPYPIEFVREAIWRTTEESIELLERVGFASLELAQTLLTHPRYSNVAAQDPVPGHDRGDYVAIRARRPA